MAKSAKSTKRPRRTKTIASARSASALKIQPLTAADWHLVAELFGDKGACGGCWCMYWRVNRGGRTWDNLRGKPARKHFHDLVVAGKVGGLLALSGDTPIGWVCVGRYRDFPRLDRVRAFARDRPAGTWSIVCFYILPKFRRSGLATKLLVAARDLALSRSATVVEGYPVTVRSKQGLPGAFAWTGVPAMFARAGFRRLGGATQSRHIWVSDGAAARRK